MGFFDFMKKENKKPEYKFDKEYGFVSNLFNRGISVSANDVSDNYVKDCIDFFQNMDDEQTKVLARMIAAEYKDMKLSVIMLFFYRFKCGHFGRFYGKVDPMVITCALKDFAEECEAKSKEYIYPKVMYIGNEDEEPEKIEKPVATIEWE